eukprot:192265_1
MSEYMKCDVFPAENMDFTPFISTQIEESLRLIITLSDKSIANRSKFHSLFIFNVEIQDVHGIRQGRVRWDMNMHSNHEWNPNNKICPHHHSVKDKYNEKYNYGNVKWPINGEWKYVNEEDEKKQKDKKFCYGNDVYNDSVITRDDIETYKNAP